MTTLIEVDSTITSPAARRFEQLGLAIDLRTVVAVVSHGVWEGVHHIEVREGDDGVVVTAYVGTLRTIAERQARGEVMTFVMKAVLRPFRVELTTPLGDRLLRDGAVGYDRA